jgi:hypothetical protein
MGRHIARVFNKGVLRTMNEHCEYECVDYEKHQKETMLFPNRDELIFIGAISYAIILNSYKKKYEEEMEDD